MFVLNLLFLKVVSTSEAPEYCNSWNSIDNKCEEWMWNTGPILENNEDTGKRAICPSHICSCPEDASKCDCNQITEYGKYGKVLDKDGETTGDCMKCTSYCSSCTENPDICDDCKSNDSGKVLDANNQFIGVCMPCIGQCNSCYSDYTKCEDECRYGYGKVYDSNGEFTGQCAGCFDNHCAECYSNYKKCDDCYFGFTHFNDEKEDIYNCVSCPENCLTCDKSGPNFCDYCRDGYGPEIIANKKTGRCLPCLNNCYDCSDGIDICDPYGRSVKNGKKSRSKITEKLNTPTESDNQNKKTIMEQIDNCINSYYIDNKCSNCNYGYGFEFDQNGRTGLCKECGDNCENCAKNADICTKCKEGYGFDYDENGVRMNSCKPCSTGCKSCMTHYTECTMCEDGFGFELDEEGKRNGVCKPCAVKNCQFCHFDYSKCTKCFDNYGFVKNDPARNGQCERCSSEGCIDCYDDYTFCQQCQEDGFAKGNTKGTCLQCPLHCDVCIDPEICFLCLEGFGLVKDGNGKITGECRKCPDNCKECIYESQCKECNKGFGVDSKGQCHKCPDGCICNGDSIKCDKCLDGYYPSGDKCLKCKETCKTCNDEQRCKSCFDGYFMENGECISCGDHCEYCYYDGHCHRCEQNYKFDENQICVPCPVGYKYCDYYISCDNGYGPSFIDNNMKNFECKQCPKNCMDCRYNYQFCFMCKDGYYFDANRECVPYGCTVSNCIKCIDGSLDECEQCLSPYKLNEKRQCTLPYTTALSPTPVPIIISIDYVSQLKDGVLQIIYDNDDELTSNQQFNIKLDENYNIKRIKIPQNYRNSLIELPAKFSEMTFESETKTNIDIICNSDSMNLAIDSNSYAFIRNAKGSITITNAKSDQNEVKINVIQPLSSTLTLIPKTQVKINEVDLNGHKSLIVKNDANSKVEITKLKVQQASVGEVQSVKITETIIFGLSSYLKVNENVDFSQATLDFSYETNSKETAPLNGVIKGKPQKILINERVNNKYLDDQKILLVESSEKFECDEWGKLIESNIKDNDFSSFECKEENNLYRLYAINKESKDDKLPPGVIAAIVIAVVVVVGVVVFLLVYFLVIKKRKNNESDNEGSDGNNNENNADEV